MQTVQPQSTTNRSNRWNWRIVLQIGMVLIISYLPIVNWPFSWFQTFFHEMSHGLSAILTGGSIEQIELHWNGSGLCYTRGGILFVVTFSGYFGAIVWGTAIYLIATMSRRVVARTIVIALMVMVAVTTLLWVRDLITLLICGAIALLLWATYSLRRFNLTREALQVIGLYVLFDATLMPLHLLDGRSVGDGARLAQLTHIPEMVWVGIWFAIAIITVWRLIVTSAHLPEPEERVDYPAPP